MKKVVLAVVAALLAGGIFFYLTACPCERLPGMWLTGAEVDLPQEDWSFVNEEKRCELEVSSWRPHSVTLNCMADGGDLFISCSRCDGKYWSGVALEQPNGRIRIAGQVYPVSLTRLEDDASLDRAWRARITKLGQEGERPGHWWSFQLTSRS